jgi:integrase
MARTNRPRKHYGKWRIRWTDADGKRRSETFEDYEAALLTLRRYELELIEVKRGLRQPTPKDHLFSALTRQWLETRAPMKRSANSDESILKCHLMPAFSDALLSEISPLEVNRLVASIDRSPKTIHNILTLLIAMLNYAVDIGWLTSAPRIRKPTIRKAQSNFRYLKTREDIDRFLLSARSDGEHIHALYATAVWTGMRFGELAGLRTQDVDLQTRLITVQRSYDHGTKNGDSRQVPVLDVLLPTLERWLGHGGGPLVFTNRDGRMHQSAARVAQEVLHRVLDRAGFAVTTRCGTPSRRTG